MKPLSVSVRQVGGIRLPFSDSAPAQWHYCSPKLLFSRGNSFKCVLRTSHVANSVHISILRLPCPNQLFCYEVCLVADCDWSLFYLLRITQVILYMWQHSLVALLLPLLNYHLRAQWCGLTFSLPTWLAKSSSRERNSRWRWSVTIILNLNHSRIQFFFCNLVLLCVVRVSLWLRVSCGYGCLCTNDVSVR